MNTKDRVSVLSDTNITYLKVVRNDTTVFIESSETDTCELVKSKVEKFFSNDIRLYYKGRMLDDNASLYQQSIQNGAEIYVTKRSNVNDSGWETLEEVGGDIKE